MKNREEKNEHLNLFDGNIDMSVLFGIILVFVFIYFIIMCYFFNCGHDSCSKTLWGSAANFGNMFGALGCLFSGFAFAAMWATLKKQGEQLKSQEESTELSRESIHQTERLNEKGMIISMIDGLDKAISNISVMDNKGNEASAELFDLAIKSIKSIQKSEADRSYYQINKFTTTLHRTFYHIMLKSLCILKFINDSKTLLDEDKKTLALYFISSISTSTKKLLNIMFLLNDSLKEFEILNSLVFGCKAPLFSHEKTYNMIKDHAKVEDYIIDTFIEITKDMWSVHR